MTCVGTRGIDVFCTTTATIIVSFPSSFTGGKKRRGGGTAVCMHGLLQGDIALRHTLLPQMAVEVFPSFCLVGSQLMTADKTGGECMRAGFSLSPPPFQLVEGTRAIEEVDVLVWQK